jgi:hypothetical protein
VLSCPMNGMKATLIAGEFAINSRDMPQSEQALCGQFGRHGRYLNVLGKVHLCLRSGRYGHADIKISNSGRNKTRRSTEEAIWGI